MAVVVVAAAVADDANTDAWLLLLLLRGCRQNGWGLQADPRLDKKMRHAERLLHNKSLLLLTIVIALDDVSI